MPGEPRGGLHCTPGLDCAAAVRPPQSGELSCGYVIFCLLTAFLRVRGCSPPSAQGSAADLAKAAMVAIHTQLAARLPAPSSANGGAGDAGGNEAGGAFDSDGGAGSLRPRLVLQIHDEFLLEVPGGWGSSPMLPEARRHWIT